MALTSAPRCARRSAGGENYLGFTYAILARRRQRHLGFRTKIQPPSAARLFSVAAAGSSLSPLDGQFTKPAQLSWLAAIFGGFDRPAFGTLADVFFVVF